MNIKNRSVFDLTHEKKLSCNMGELVPVFCEEVLPGDTFKVKTDMLVRLSPMLAPVMHRITAYTHFFFVPTRLLHSNWENFITGGPTGNDATVIPTIKSPASTGYAPGTLWDYLGLPTGVGEFSALAYPFRAYDLIFNEWYRDQNLQDKLTISLGDGLDTTTVTDLQKRNWEKDYFTSSLPWPQRGTGVSIPVGGAAPVELNDSTNVQYLKSNITQNNTPSLCWKSVDHPTVSYTGYFTDSVDSSLFRYKLDPNGTLEADLSSATPVTINALRQAFQLQKWMEKNARGGARYVESILAHFGIRSSDARLQRPEFLGGGRSPIVVSEIVQTSSTDETSPQGNMSGHGYSAASNHEFVKGFEEHGYIIGILSIMPKTAYMQGSPRMFNRRTRLDFYWPEFAHLGEQAILNKELYAASANPEGVFGYTPRYDEYRQRESSVHGDFRTSMNYWHLSRIFDTEPTLSSGFVSANPSNRIFAVTDAGVHHCYVQLLNQVQAVRPLPKAGIPGFIDH